MGFHIARREKRQTDLAYAREAWCPFEWANKPPSRRLKKLYRALDALDKDITYARERRYCLEHAPSDISTRRWVVSILVRERYRLIERINLLQNGD